jgi:hypothetical protein
MHIAAKLTIFQTFSLQEENHLSLPIFVLRTVWEIQGGADELKRLYTKIVIIIVYTH